MRKHAAILFLSIGAMCHAQVGAESADTLSHTLGEVTVRGTGTPKEVTSAAPVRLVDADRIVRTGVTDVSDALHRMAGVNLRDYGGAGGLKTVMVRGFGAGHTGVAYDGVPLSDVQSGQIDLSRYSIDNVAGVSLVVGDNDDIFIPARMAASAATVGISTLPARDRREVEAKMRFGSFGFYNPYVRLGLPLGEDAALSVVADFTHADNDYPFTLRNGTVVTRERRTNSRLNSGHGEVGMVWDLNTTNTLTAKAYYYDCSRRLPGPVIYYTSVSHERLAERNAMAQASWRSRLSGCLSLYGIGKFNYATSFYSDENGKYPGGKLDQRYWQREWYTAWALMYVPSANWLMDYSADYFYNSLNSNLPTDRRPYRHSMLQSATVKYVLGSRLRVMGRLLCSIYRNGARTGESARNATRLSPSLSVSYRPFDGRQLYLRASYKEIFRMPTFNEAYFDHYGTPDVRPENTRQLNLGVTYTMSRGALAEATVTLDGYHNSVTDMIVAVPYNMFVWTMTNLGKVRILGLDASVDVSVCPASVHTIAFSASYSLQRAAPRTNPDAADWNKQVAYIPRHSGSASLSYENPWANVSLTATAVSARYTTNDNLPATRIPGYAEIGASVWRNIKLGRNVLGLRVDLLNLLDKQYYIVARYPMPGRQWRLTLTYKF